MNVVVLGAGAPGEHFAGALRDLDASVRITMIEQELVGGECSYWACIPSKTLLRSPDVVAAARGAPGAAEAMSAPVDRGRIFSWRDEMVANWDDTGQADWLAGRNVELVRGKGRIAEPGLAVVGAREVRYDRLVLATGSLPTAPPIAGLDESGYWTSRDGTSTCEVSESLIVLVGGGVGCEVWPCFY